MKFWVLAAGLLLFIPGCAQSPEPDEEPDKGARRSVGGSADNETQYDTVIFFETGLSLAGPDSTSFDVTVPANVAAVYYHLAWDTAAQLFGLRVELSGCGTYDQGLGSQTSGGQSASDNPLCTQATAGDQTVTISNTGYIDGTFSLRAKIPRENQTAPP